MRSICLFGLIIVIHMFSLADVANGQTLPSLQKSTCSDWISYDNNFISYYTNLWESMGVSPGNIEKERWLRSAEQNRKHYVLGIIDAFSAVYEMQKSQEFHFSLAIDNYLQEIDIICENSTQESIISILFDVNKILIGRRQNSTDSPVDE